MQATQQPDTKPGPYYVTAIDNGRVHLMAGPFGEHAEALGLVDKAREIAYEHDGRAWFMAWGTSRVEGCEKLGSLNRHGLI